MAELKNIRIAISGLYDYALEELPSLRLALPGQGAPDFVEKKNIYKVYRPANVLAAACDKFKLLPLTHHHPQTPVDGQNFRDLAIGYTGENPWVDYLKGKDEVGIRSSVMLYDDEAFDAYDRGERQLSPGYIANFEWVQNGKTPKGEPYDIIMTAITDVNHLALLPAGRGGEDAVVMDRAPSIFDLVRMPADGAPFGNDNASKDHKKEEEIEGLGEAEKEHLKDVLEKNVVPFKEVEFSKENYDKYLGQPINTPLGKVKMGANQFEKLSKNHRQNLILAVHDTLEKPCFIAEEKGGTTLYVKSFNTGKRNKNIMSVVIKRDGLNISISAHEERTGQILDKIKKAGVLSETSGDDGTVHDERVADTTRVVSLNIVEDDESVKLNNCYMTIFDRVKGTVFDLYK